jgi:hypothetical protein
VQCLRDSCKGDLPRLFAARASTRVRAEGVGCKVAKQHPFDEVFTCYLFLCKIGDGKAPRPSEFANQVADPKPTTILQRGLLWMSISRC